MRHQPRNQASVTNDAAKRKGLTMKEQMHRALRRCTACACALSASAALLAPGAAFAAFSDDGDKNTTEVTVAAADGNLEFTVPTVIAFAAMPDGKLQAANPENLVIENRSIFAIHVTNMAVSAESPWTLVENATASSANNSISFKVGPNMYEQSAYAASTTGGIDLSSSAAWDMGFANSESSSLELNAAGNISNTTQDLSLDGGVKAATITWTIEAGQHHDAQSS